MDGGNSVFCRTVYQSGFCGCCGGTCIGGPFGIAGVHTEKVGRMG